MSPEQVEGKRADVRSDIFAFCLVLYELIIGTRVFDGTSAASVAASILKDPPRPMSDVPPLVPKALDALVQTCLANDPVRVGVRELKNIEPRLLTGTEGAQSAIWSPDSQRIAFGLRNQLRKIDVTGGRPKRCARSMVLWVRVPGARAASSSSAAAESEDSDGFRSRAVCPYWSRHHKAASRVFHRS